MNENLWGDDFRFVSFFNVFFLVFVILLDLFFYSFVMVIE